MQTVPLSPSVSDSPHELERGTEAAIAGEIAERILEYRDEVSASRAMSFIQKLAAISTINKDAFWMLLHLLSGDLNAITESYASQGKSEALDKQAVQQRTERALSALQKHYPECAVAIIQLRHITANIK